MMDTLKFKNNSYVVVFQVVTLRLILVLFIFFKIPHQAFVQL